MYSDMSLGVYTSNVLVSYASPSLCLSFSFVFFSSSSPFRCDCMCLYVSAGVSPPLNYKHSVVHKPNNRLQSRRENKSRYKNKTTVQAIGSEFCCVFLSFSNIYFTGFFFSAVSLLIEVFVFYIKKKKKKSKKKQKNTHIFFALFAVINTKFRGSTIKWLTFFFLGGGLFEICAICYFWSSFLIFQKCFFFFWIKWKNT